MPYEAFQSRWPENVPGKFYVGNQCLDYDLCRQIAPENFSRKDERGYSYIKKQPETPDQLARCHEALAGCCTETIYEDGNLFDRKSSLAA